MTQRKKSGESTHPFLNRELSWLEFNDRVLGEALRADNPILERLKFIGIVSSNLDEFFMVRVAGLKRQLLDEAPVVCPSGIGVAEQLDRVGKKVRQIIAKQYRCLTDDLLPALESEGLELVHPAGFNQEQTEIVENLFRASIFPVLTPVRIEEEGQVPFIANRMLYLAFDLVSNGHPNERKVALILIPEVLERVVWLPAEGKKRAFVLLEDVLSFCARTVFPGFDITGSLAFRITRDADLGVDEERDEDFLEAMEEIIARRERSVPVRYEDSGGNLGLRSRITSALGIRTEDTFECPGPLDLTVFGALASLPGYERLKGEPLKHTVPAPLQDDVDLWDLLRSQDILLHHPYESFEPVIRLLRTAAADPDVLAIKITLYRTSGDSPIIQALIDAAAAGKQVAAVVELKARFDEEQNIEWAHRLERSGVIVIYGIAHLKVHAKAMLIVRRESGGVRRYLHLSTGNYNDKTARLYTDFGLMTAREDLTFDAAQFFNAVTGYSSVSSLDTLVMAPFSLKTRIIELIEREIERHSSIDPGLIMAKLNAVADTEIIEALYRASRAGVKIRLNVRGVCMLVPGLKGTSENIEVVSIVDRLLEHSRILYFRNGGNEEVYLSSADWMQRNLDRRIELMFPVLQPDLKARLKTALETFLSDNVRAHVLQPDGSYLRVEPADGSQPLRSQETFYRRLKLKAETSRSNRLRELNVRRKAPDR